jgi:hypothetical protein
LEKIIEDGLADTTNPRVRLAIYKTLMKRADQLSRDIERNSNAKEFAAEFLNGPQLQLGISTSAKPAIVDA